MVNTFNYVQSGKVLTKIIINPVVILFFLSFLHKVFQFKSGVMFFSVYAQSLSDLQKKKNSENCVHLILQSDWELFAVDS